MAWSEKSKDSKCSSMGDFQDQFLISSTVWRLRSSMISCTRRSEVAANSWGDGWPKKSSMFVWSITFVILWVSDLLGKGLAWDILGVDLGSWRLIFRWLCRFRLIVLYPNCSQIYEQSLVWSSLISRISSSRMVNKASKNSHQ